MPGRRPLPQSSKSLAGKPDIIGSTCEMIEARLRAEIVEGRLKPGERITQQSVADSFNVSHIPVREALRMLETQGYLEGELHKSYVVAGKGISPRTDSLPRLLRMVGSVMPSLMGLKHAQRLRMNFCVS